MWALPGLKNTTKMVSVFQKMDVNKHRPETYPGIGFEGVKSWVCQLDPGLTFKPCIMTIMGLQGTILFHLKLINYPPGLILPDLLILSIQPLNHSVLWAASPPAISFPDTSLHSQLIPSGIVFIFS